MPAILEYVRDEALPDRDEILDRLASHDREVLLRVLTLLCPCRNQCYDVIIWSQLPAICRSQWDFEVREAAGHALGSLNERARVDRRAAALLDELAASGMGLAAYAPWVQRAMKAGIRPEDMPQAKLALRDVPTLIEVLSSDDAWAIDGAIQALCPMDGRNVPRRVWRAIFDSRRLPAVTDREKVLRARDRLSRHALVCSRHGR